MTKTIRKINTLKIFFPLLKMFPKIRTNQLGESNSMEKGGIISAGKSIRMSQRQERQKLYHTDCTRLRFFRKKQVWKRFFIHVSNYNWLKSIRKKKAFSQKATPSFSFSIYQIIRQVVKKTVLPTTVSNSFFIIIKN